MNLQQPMYCLLIISLKIFLLKVSISNAFGAQFQPACKFNLCISSFPYYRYFGEAKPISMLKKFLWFQKAFVQLKFLKCWIVLLPRIIKNCGKQIRLQLIREQSNTHQKHPFHFWIHSQCYFQGFSATEKQQQKLNLYLSFKNQL